MEMTEILLPANVFVGLPATDKREILQLLAAKAAGGTGLGEGAILEVLLERERLGTTGVGKGIAIPHGKLTGLKAPFGLLARLAHPIPFEAVDDGPVDLLFLLLAPESAGAEHLKALARVSRLLRDRRVCDQLRKAETAERMYAALAVSTRSHAA